MIWNLLAEETEQQTGGWQSYSLYILLGVIIVAIIAYSLFSGRKSKQRQKEYIEQLEAIRPGHKVKTVGGICGVVAEVCDDNTIIIETGSEASGKSYIKMDKEMIAQTDAKGPTQLAREEAEAAKKAEKEGKPSDGTAGEKSAQDPAQANPSEMSAPPEEKPEEKPEENG